MTVPVFCAEVFTTATTATFTWTPASGPSAFSLSWSVPPGLYWLGALASPANPSLGDAFADALTAADTVGLGWTYTVTALSDNIGATCRLTRVQFSNPGGTLAATNAAGSAVLWALGFRNTSSVAITTALGGVTRYADSNGIPFGTWWPKAHNVNRDRFSPVSAQVATSGLAGSGTTVATIRQDDGTVGRWFREFDCVPVSAARCSVRRAASLATPQWATIAGLTTNPSDAALDNPGWWWSRVVDGSYRFAVIEDEAQLVSGTPRYGIYRIVYDSDCPVQMGGFKGLRSPNLDVYSPGGARQRFRFGAVVTSLGNL
jgi:hypothetical protein